MAVIVCGVLAMPIGAVWYGPIFGKAWMKEIGKTEDEIREGFNPAKTYSLAFIGHLVVALVLAYFLSLTGAQSVADSVRVSLTAWVGFVGATMFINGLFSGISTRLFMINSGYFVMILLVYGIILGLW
ncbi:DUF1761 domain-containing protein [Bacteroidota bacterium]